MVKTNVKRTKHRGQAIFYCQIVPKSGPAGNRYTLPIKTRIQIALKGDYFVFYLNEDILPALQLAESEGYILKISSTLLSNLRRYALFDDEGYPQSGLTFCTHYTDNTHTCNAQNVTLSEINSKNGADIAVPPVSFPEGKLVLRTVVSLDGDVIHQVDDAHLRHPHCLAIASAHHWLINQLMGRLRLSFTSPVEIILVIVPSTIVAATVLANLTSLLQTPLEALRWIGLSCSSFALPIARKELKAFVWRTIIAPPRSLKGRAVKWLLGRIVS
jgi:hypothetical protein